MSTEEILPRLLHDLRDMRRDVPADPGRDGWYQLGEVHALDRAATLVSDALWELSTTSASVAVDENWRTR